MSSYSNSTRNVGGTKSSPGKPGTSKIQNTAFQNSTAENCYKTPNKSGLTPVRPKSENKQSGTKLKSGLTPTRPGVDRSIGKSPFPGSKQKLKSGLQPIKPTDGKQQTSSSLDFDNSSFANRRKSGLKPIKPGGMFGCSNLNNSVMTSGYNFSSGFLASASKPSNNFDFVPPSTTRRKSGLVPTKSRMSIGQGNLASVQRQPQWQPKVAPIRELSRIPGSNQNSRFNRNNHAKGSTDSLNNIQEGDESPGNSRNDVSGIRSLDETLEMSVVLRPRASHQGAFTRFPQPIPGSNLSTYDTSKSRIPKRVLHFDEEDEPTITNNARIDANVLKDGSSRVNIAEETKISSNPSPNEPSNQEETLLLRKKQIESEMQKMSIELEKVNQQLSQLKCKKASTETENQSANSSSAGTSEIGQDDSPFAHVPSPLSADPLELLPLENSKRPENIYKVFRQSCSFLKTPQASAFRKTEAGQRTSAMHAAVDETPNISRRLQKQLADLFDE